MENPTHGISKVQLRNKDFYIGRTNDLARRHKEHTIQVLAHAKGKCKLHPCPACDSYKRQARLAASEWLMAPLHFCMGLGEAKSMERRLIKNFNPNLNWEYKKSHAGTNSGDANYQAS